MKLTAGFRRAPAALDDPPVDSGESHHFLPIPSRQSMLRFRSMLLLFALAAAACIPLPRGHALSRRTVWSKQGEDTLVAQDGSWCRVTATTFARVRVGDDHTCVWKEVGASGAGRVVSDVRGGAVQNTRGG